MMNSPTKTPTSKRANLVNRLRHDRGAVLVEAAICIPILLLLVLGLTESGFAWEARSATVSGVRTGVLRASSLAGDQDTDLRVLQSVIGEIGAENVDNLNWVMIFEAGGDAEAKFQDCLAALPSCDSVIYNNSANLFTDIVAIPDGMAGDTFALNRFEPGTGFDPATGDYTCVGGGWCPGERIDDGDTTLAVAINYTHPWLTGIFPFGDPTFEEYVVSSTFTDGGVDITATGP